MKKRLLAIMMTVSVMALAGCGSNEKVISGDVTSNTTATEADTTAAEETVSDASAAGYVFTVNGVDVAIGAEAAAIIDSIGGEPGYYEAASCAFGDLDKSYTYSGYEIDTYQQEGVDYISSVILMDDTVATPEGLAIGDPGSKVTELYGEPTDTDGDMSVYRSGDMKLAIQIQSDAVTSIQYLNTLLDD